jgi:hypothetical protein
MKQEDSRNEINGSEKDAQLLSDYEDIINRGNLGRLNASDPNVMLKKLSMPQFVGSYHLKNPINQGFKSIENLFKGSSELKYTKSLKSIIFNPLTIVLIIITLVFNLFWLFTLLF